MVLGRRDAARARRATDDGVLVGTGNKGKLYRVRDDRTWTHGRRPSPPSRSRASCARRRARSSSPPRTPAASTPWRRRRARAGTFTSKVKDTDTVSSWGRVRWEAALPAGTGDPGPDAQREHRHAGQHLVRLVGALRRTARATPIASEPARFLQMQAALSAQQRPVRRVLDTLSAAYLQRNLRPADPDHHRASRRARSSRSRSRSPARRRSSASSPRQPDRTPRPRPASRAPACRPPPPTAASCTRRASRPSPGRPTTPTATPSPTTSTTAPLRDSAVPPPAQGADRRRCWPGTPRTVPNGRYVIR